MSRSIIPSLRQFATDLRRLPRTVSQRVTSTAAPAITALAKATFAAGTDPYGHAWAPGVDGQSVTLRQTGDLEKFVFYVGIGRALRVSLGVKHARYQIGKRPVFPRQDGALPASYVQTLSRIAVDIIRQELRGQ